MLKKINIILLLLSIVLSISCDDLQETDSTNGTLQALERLVADLNNSPQEWETLINGCITELGTINEDLAPTVSQELEFKLETAQQVIRDMFFCSSDFVIEWVQTEVLAVGNYHFPNTFDEPVYNPHVCSTSPSEFIIATTRYLFISGYYFIKYQGDFSAHIEDGANSVIISDLGIETSGDYKLTVNLLPVPWSEISWSELPDSAQLVISWEGGYSTIPLGICPVEHPEVENPDYQPCVDECIQDANDIMMLEIVECEQQYTDMMMELICTNNATNKANAAIEACDDNCEVEYPPTPAYSDYHVCEE